MTLIEAIASDFFSNVRKIGRLTQPRDHAAGCIAQDKRDQMIKIAAHDKNCLHSGGEKHVRIWSTMTDKSIAYQNELSRIIDKEITFRRSKDKRID